MKILKLLSKVLLFVLTVAVSLWIFMPWDKVSEYAVINAQNRLAKSGLTTKYGSTGGSWRGPEFSFNELSVSSMMGGISFKNITVKAEPLTSLFRFAPVALVTFSGGSIVLPGNIETSLGNGSFSVLLRGNVLCLESMTSKGELSIQGGVNVDLSSSKLDAADLLLKTPDKIENSLSSLKSFLPLTRESKGTWRIKREKKPNA